MNIIKTKNILNPSIKSLNDMNEVLRKNTEVISELNLEIARLRTELDRIAHEGS